jgi:hypothetical protein
MCKRSHATQSTISRFACRILVDRKPPYTARIYAAGFDSSKNIFLGEKATKWEQNDSIDGLTTNGVLLMHPKQGNFYQDSDEFKQASHRRSECSVTDSGVKLGDSSDNKSQKQICSKVEPNKILNQGNFRDSERPREGSSINKSSISDTNQSDISDHSQADRSSDSNNNNNNDETANVSKQLDPKIDS